MDEDNTEKFIKEALIKRACGYDADEVTEEYSFEDGVSKLAKKKITKKHYAPDMLAIKFLISFYGNKSFEEISSMTDEELYEERTRLIKQLKEEQNEN